MATRPRTQELHGIAGDGEDASEGGIYAEEREAVTELMKNCCAQHNCVAQGAGMLICSFANSDSSTFRALFCHRSRRFYTT